MKKPLIEIVQLILSPEECQSTIQRIERSLIDLRFKEFRLERKTISMQEERTYLESDLTEIRMELDHLKKLNNSMPGTDYSLEFSSRIIKLEGKQFDLVGRLEEMKDSDLAYSMFELNDSIHQRENAEEFMLKLNERMKQIAVPPKKQRKRKSPHGSEKRKASKTN